MTTKKKMLQAAAGNIDSAVLPFGVDFDGTNDYLSRSSDLVGNTDSKTFTFSCWFYVTDSGGVQFFCDSSGGGFRVQSSFRRIKILAEDSGGSSVLVGAANNAPYSRDGWNHVLISADMSNTSNRSIYINGQEQTSEWTTFVNSAIGFSQTTHYLGSDFTGGSKIKGRLAGVYLDYTYRDLSVEANRRDFIDADGLYVTPPTSGIISVPMDDPDDVGRNDGTGGDFTLNGTVARSGRGPNQYNAVASEFDGSADRLVLTGFGTIPDSKVTTISTTFRADSSSENIFQIANGGSTHIWLNKTNANDEMQIRVYDRTAGAYALEATIDGVVYGQNNHITISIDLTGSSSGTKCYVNGVERTMTFATFDNTKSISYGDPSLPATNINVASNSSSAWWEGSIGDLYIDPTSAVDLSTENPFYDVETNKPKYLGASGELPTGSSPLVYLPLRADDAGNNLGTGGDFTVISGPFVGARGASEFLARSAYNNGSSGNRLYNGSATHSLAAGRTFSFFTYVDMNSVKTWLMTLFDTSGGTIMRIEVGQGASSGNVLAWNPAGAVVLNAVPSGGVANSWNTVFVSIDMDNQSNCHVIITGTDSPTYSTFTTGSDIKFNTLGSIAIGSQTIAVSSATIIQSVHGCYLTTDYIDFSQEANRLKFVDGLGYPVDLQPAIGAGDIPTPLTYMKFDDPDALGTNSGSGGDFTVTGTVTSGSDVKG
jgi:hypothetical protein